MTSAEERLAEVREYTDRFAFERDCPNTNVRGYRFLDGSGFVYTDNLRPLTGVPFRLGRYVGPQPHMPYLWQGDQA